jgi:hypothetical protein
MNEKINKKYVFTLSNLKFLSDPSMLVRVPRQANWFDLSKLVSHSEKKLNLTQNVAFYNDFPDTVQSLETQNERELVVKARFSDKDLVNEFGSLIIDTNINIWQEQYLSMDLSVEDGLWQYYDLALQIDTDYDNLADQTIWMDAVKFDEGKKKTVFYDLMAILQSKQSKYDRPRLLGVKILPHRVAQIPNKDNRELKFSISNISFYQEGELVQSQLQQIPTLHAKVNMPQTGEYEMFVNVNGNANDDSFLIAVGGQNLEVTVKKADNNVWKKVGVVNLTQGENWLTLISYNGSFAINNLAFFKTDNKYGKINNEVVNWQKINPAKYVANLNIRESGTLVLKESYHPAWKMMVYKKGSSELVSETRPFLINGWQQGYNLDLPVGEYDVVWEYDLTLIYHVLLLITGVFLVGAVGWLVWERNLNK